MKCDIRTTIGLAVIAAIAGVGVTLAMLKDIQLRTDLFSASPSAQGGQAQVSSKDAGAATDSRNGQAPSLPPLEAARSGLNADRGEANDMPAPDPRADGRNRADANAGSGRLKPELTGDLKEARPSELDTSRRIASAATGESSGEPAEASAEGDASASEDADAEAPEADGKDADGPSESGQATVADASQADGRAADQKGAGADQNASEDSGSSDGQGPQLKSLGAVDYSKMSRNISQVSTTLERFNEKLLKAIGQAKEKQEEQQSAEPDASGSGDASAEADGAAEQDSSESEGEDPPRLPEIEIEFEDSDGEEADQ